MLLRGILSKIIGLLLLFNLALWSFIFFTEDTAYLEITNKRDRLYERAVMYRKLITPLFENQSLSEFERKLAIEGLLRDSELAGIGKVVVKRFSDLKSAESFEYFNGQKPIKLVPISVQELAPEPAAEFDVAKNRFDPFEYLFTFYKDFVDLQLVTDPIVPIRARFSMQYHLIDSGQDAYELKYLAPIKIARKTVATIAVRDSYFLRESYMGKNKSRLTILAGLSALTLVLGVFLALSIAFPIRSLSKRLNRKLKAETVSEQLNDFRIKRFEHRKDEIGFLYRNLVTLNGQLSKLFSDKERFAADVSHELKNPLASIIAHVENTRTETTNTEQSAKGFEAIHDQAVRMNKLISEISEAAIVDHDLVATKREKFNLSELVQDLAGHFETEAEREGVKLVADLQSNVKLTGLPDRIAQVVINLVENAISFSKPNGEVYVELKKSWRRGISISVSDTGPGVPDDLHDKIFGRFFSARSGAAEKPNSSGLGLYICKQVIEAHGGSITQANGSPLPGATFTVRF